MITQFIGPIIHMDSKKLFTEITMLCRKPFRPRDILRKYPAIVFGHKHSKNSDKISTNCPNPLHYKWAVVQLANHLHGHFNIYIHKKCNKVWDNKAYSLIPKMLFLIIEDKLFQRLIWMTSRVWRRESSQTLSDPCSNLQRW